MARRIAEADDELTPEEALEILATPRAALEAALRRVRAKFDAGKDDWAYSLLLTFREFSLASGIEPKLIMPIEKLLLEKQDEILRERTKPKAPKAGRPPRPLRETMPMTLAAAAVTVLVKRGESLRNATRHISRLTKIDPAALTAFYNNVLYGRGSPAALAAYPGVVAEIEKWDDLLPLAGIGKIL